MKRAVFLDRDGTLVEDPGYLHKPSEVVLLPGVADALNRLGDAGWLRVVVTNQSGIDRGFFQVEDLDSVHAELARQLRLSGAVIDGWYHCPHLPEAGCDCRKPGTALHRRAAAELDINLAASWCVGDRMSDIIPASSLGARAVLVQTGHGADHAAVAMAAGIAVVGDLAAAVELILNDPANKSP
jgi:D-glycero-D-manno-heptose 1,7-bisphosphate phosphatase